jgi:hypothetical protein
MDPSIVSFIVVARHNGMTCYRIAAMLNRMGVEPVRGRQWWPSTVRRLSERHSPLGQYLRAA